MYENYETLKITREGRVLTVAFNRPEVKNATNSKMHQELLRILPEIGRDADAHVVVLTGEGDAFSAGGDIETLRISADHHGRWNESMREAREIVMALVELDRPTIAKVNGHAIGLGCTLALLCDIIIAREDAKLADPHVKVGLVAGDGGSIIWPALIGYARAKRYLFTGDAITGAEAAKMGLATESCPAEELDGRVQTIAHRLAGGATMAIRLTKKAVNMELRQRLDSLLEAHLGYETMSHLTADHREALDAFANKRAPVFSGK
jgi:enoyl-CoA hydratase